MPYLDRDGVRLYYERLGAGDPTLVFVHGFACSHEDWQPQIDYFHTRQTVIACDLRGHGISGGVPENCSIETFGADLVALLDSLNLRYAILIGHSMGCRAVLQAYLDAPHRIAGLILVDGSRFATGDPLAAEQTAHRMLESAGYPAVLRRLFDDMFFEGNDAAIRERLVSRALSFPADIGAALIPRVWGWDARNLDRALCRIAVPLMALQSTDVNEGRVRVPLRPGATTPWLELIRRHVPAARIEIVSGVGHFSMLEAPEAVNRCVADFVDKVFHR